MKKSRILILKLVVVTIGLIILALCVFALPKAATYFAEIGPEFAYLKYPVLFGIYATTIPFYFALTQAMKLLNLIRDNPFTDLASSALKWIKISATTIGAMYIIGILFLNTQGGALNPGIALLGILIAAASFVIAVFASVMQELVGRMIEIKAENDLVI